MKVVILAGGGGTRLFPLSRTGYPKQFLKIRGEHSLLAQTALRFATLVAPEDMIIVTNKQYYHSVIAELKNCRLENAHVVLEPAARNTAPAIALAARYCLDNLSCHDNEVMFVTPSDHIIHPTDVFIKRVQDAVNIAVQGFVVTLGVTPSKPETGYGYIQAGEKSGESFAVLNFKEKPDQKTAEQYLKAGNFYWNAGMFAFSINTIMDEFRIHKSEIYNLATGSFADVVQNFAAMPDISIDYAVAEKSKKVRMIPLDACWNDIGSWDAIYEVLDKDSAGNVTYGDCKVINCTNTLIYGRDRLIAGIGLEDTLVVETDDVIVVAKRGESQRVKDLVALLKEQKRREADEHTTTYRPWGSYTILGEGTGYKIKKIVVYPGEKLSLQMHYHRSEHWIVTQGTAKVTIGSEERMVHENESVFVPKSTLHRLENPGKIPLVIIEVQNGNYLEEDDIVRFDDIYGRSN